MINNIHVIRAACVVTYRGLILQHTFSMWHVPRVKMPLPALRSGGGQQKHPPPPRTPCNQQLYYQLLYINKVSRNRRKAMKGPRKASENI